MSNKDTSVLIAEDDYAVRKLFADCANGIGCTVVEAASITSTLSLIRQADILFLDWALEDGEAGPVFNEWIAMQRGPMLVVTGVLSREKCESLLIAGADHVIIKPITVELILTLLRRYCATIEERRYVASLDEKVVGLQEANKKLMRMLLLTTAIALVGAGPQASEFIRSLLTLF